MSLLLFCFSDPLLFRLGIPSFPITCFPFLLLFEEEELTRSGATFESVVAFRKHSLVKFWVETFGPKPVARSEHASAMAFRALGFETEESKPFFE